MQYHNHCPDPEKVEQAWQHDDQVWWYASDTPPDPIMNYRSSMINSRTSMKVKKINSLLEKFQLIAMGSKPVDIEIKLDKNLF